jgi:hypothetical protein
MVLVLEAPIVNRLRGNERKDGNPLNEVRMLAASILEKQWRSRCQQNDQVRSQQVENEVQDRG